MRYLPLFLVACGTAPAPFSLNFAPVSGTTALSCTQKATGMGSDASHTVGINDLRFYVSNLHFHDSAGKEVPVTLDENEFQYRTTDWVGLVDLTDNSTGTCATSAITYGEGTQRTHTAITGTTRVADVVRVTFDVGLPQAMMKEVIASYTAEGAPSPLAELQWSWAGGYRHFVFNFKVGDAGEGYVHLGSRGCGAEGAKALEGRAECDVINNPKVSIDTFDLAKHSVGIDVRAILAGVAFTNNEVQCHSGPMQADCKSVFSSFGLGLDTGVANVENDKVFVHLQ